MNESKLFDDFCQSCGGVEFTQKIEPLHSPHYSRIECSKCGKWKKWVSRGNTQQTSICRLLSNENLQDWEKKFLKAIAYRNPSNAEKIVLEAIGGRLNG